MSLRLYRALSLILLAASIAACSKPEEPAPAPRKAGFPPELSGEALFTERCLECHVVRDKGGQIGPDLSQVGVKRDRIFLEQAIREPSKLFPGTVMPRFDTLSKKQVDSLVDYLSGLK